VQGVFPLEEYVPAAHNVVVDSVEARRRRASSRGAESRDRAEKVGTVRAKRSAKSIVCSSEQGGHEN
jgi:hypothetical protein